MASNSIKFTASYNDSDYTRNYSLNNVADSIAADTSAIKTKINAINASLEAGTSGGMDSFFLANDYDGSSGTLAKLDSVKVVTREVTVINLDDEEG